MTENRSLFPRPPREKLYIFAKVPKIQSTINIRVVPLFYKKWAKFPKQHLAQIRSIFALGGPGVHNYHFLCVNPVN